MKKNTTLTMLFILLLLVSGCNLLGDNNTAAIPVSTTVNGPANAASFDNVTLSFNPIVVFSGNNFSYTNAAADDLTVFPTAGAAPLTGTFAYDSTTKVMTLDFTDATKTDLALTLKSFVGTGTTITAFKVSYQNKDYDVRVQQGTLAAEPTQTTTGGTTGTDNGTVVLLPDTIRGQDLTLTLTTLGQNLPTGFPYALNDTERFTISSSNLLFVGAATTTLQDELGRPKQYTGSQEYIWLYTKYGFYFALSVKTDGSLNEINVYSEPTGGSFYGQFTPTK